jgi:DNA polymerase III alpha subunit
MEITDQHLFNTKLNDRVLWYDGDISVSPLEIEKLIVQGVPVKSLFTTELTRDLEKYNDLVLTSDQKIEVKTNIKPLQFDWMIEKSYHKISVSEFIVEALESEIHGMTALDSEARIDRTRMELKLFKTKNLFPVLRLMIYVMDVFEQNNVVWGVGRGSSVSSYILYLIGIHDIDCVKFQLPIEDFIHD